ncbi:DUF4435 domain-containing protein [Pseudomonas putida]|uniref:DUF4435 domain-containing protein n=1 Tax=Pseudomonas putida TaxID=303 RepID=A0AAD0L7Q2_PSEPU|nr:DUF4435 domain-containing protein [Pseudomonas putida]AXA25891.1 hypothetical protein C1S65_17890 [Pseudomonas putida]
MIPERGTIGKYAKSIFYEDVNEIDIYIEDTALGSEKIASKIFSRIFEGRYRLDQVFPLGGRSSVISKFNEEKLTLKRPSLFIIDGDIYHLTGDNIKDEQGLYRLPCYCIENIILDPIAITSIIDEEDPVRSEEELNRAFDYAGWEKQNKHKLRDLFIEYAISRVLNPSEPTVSYEVRNLVSGSDGCLDDNKLTARLSDLSKKAINQAGEENYQYTKQQVLTQYGISTLTDLDFVSGKDYIFPLLKTRLRSTVKTALSDLNLKIRLSKICSVEKIRECADRVIGDNSGGILIDRPQSHQTY